MGPEPEDPYFSLLPAALIDLSRSLGHLDRLVEAREHAVRAVGLLRSMDREASPGLASALVELAEISAALGEADEAERLYREAVAIRTAAFGPDHASVSEALRSYADLLRRDGRGIEADSIEAQLRASGDGMS